MNEDLRGFFTVSVHETFEARLGIHDAEIETYVANLLTGFLHLDQVYGLRDQFGRPVHAITEMIEEGDVRTRANSFAREREVHRHIGDFLLFWSGLFPEHLVTLRSPAGKDALVDPVGQGKLSYEVAGSFDHAPYTEESKTLRKLSRDFELYQYGLRLLRNDLGGLAA